MTGKDDKCISKTRAFALVKALDWKTLKSALPAHPKLLRYCGSKGENALHLCCGVDIAKQHRRSTDGIKIAGALIDAGVDVNQEAFAEGEWKATPLWFAIARGKNLELGKYLLKRGATPEHCLWAAAYNDSPAAIRLLLTAGIESTLYSFGGVSVGYNLATSGQATILHAF